MRRNELAKSWSVRTCFSCRLEVAISTSIAMYVRVCVCVCGVGG